MRHIPHLFVPDWTDSESLTPNDGQVRHLEKVLRIEAGSPVEYTDGAGKVGKGVWEGATIRRGPETALARPSSLEMAVAPPASKDRQRFVVEKLAEIGVARLVWLTTKFGTNRAPSADKSKSWAVSALEQSRGAWLLDIGGIAGFADLSRPLAVCDAEGDDPPRDVRTVAVGPEGGFEPGEIPEDSTRMSLGSTTLRVETAAVVAAARLV